MKIFLSFVSTIFIFLNGNADAGVINGGGGRSIVCRLSDGKIASAQLLDLYEAQVQYGLTLAPLAGNMEEILDQVIQRVESVSFSKIQKENMTPEFNFWGDFQKMRFLPSGVALKPVEDSNDILLPSGCNVEQLAVYKSENLILVNGDIWNKLDSMNQAALVAHETIYRGLREWGATDSAYAREVVGSLFSTKNLQPVAADLPNIRDYIVCENGKNSKQVDTTFFLYQQCAGEKCNTILDFVHVEGRPVFTKTTASIDSDFYKFMTERNAFVDYNTLRGSETYVSSEIWNGKSVKVRSHLTSKGNHNYMKFLEPGEPDDNSGEIDFSGYGEIRCSHARYVDDVWVVSPL